MRILIVDDYPGAAEGTRVLLELMGHQGKTALDGTSALAAVEAFDPELVILDIGLPDLSGYEVARAIRARNSGKRVYIAAITGWGAAEDRVRSLAAGIDEHIEKPPSRTILESVISSAKFRTTT